MINLKNKNVLIIGDSYSTFKGYVPEQYCSYYSEEESEDTDVRSVTQTWWHQLISETGAHLALNNSWSGSTICNTGYGGTDCSETSSFVYRLKNFIKEDYFRKTAIDTVFVFGATNDSWAEAPLGELKLAGWTDKDLFSALPAIGFLMCKLREQLPDKDIVCVINNELKPEITKGLIDACKHNNITYIQLEDIDKSSGHPTVKGMGQIKSQVLAVCKGSV